MLFADSGAVEHAKDFATQHGFTAFFSVLITGLVAFFIWKVWATLAPVFVSAINRNSESLELIGKATVAQEKNTEALIKQNEGISTDVKEVKERIDNIENKLDQVLK